VADGGGQVSLTLKLINEVTGPAKQVQRAMKDVKKSVEQTRAAIEAPTPRSRRGATPGFDQRLMAARRSQAKDFAREQQRAVRQTQRLNTVKAREQAKEQKRIADFKQGMAQHKLDDKMGLVDFATGGLKGGAVAIGVAALAAAAAVGMLAYKFGEASVQAAAFAQQSRMALTFLLDNAPQANREFDLMRQEAQLLGLDVQDTQMGFQKLLAAQFEVGKAKELIRMSSDLQAIGASADQTKRAIVAISQIKNTGYLQGDELNQLREAGVSTELVYKELGKRLNKTVPEIIAMQEKRQLDSTNVIEAVLGAVRQKTHSSKAGEAGQKFAAETLIGMTAVMKARMQNAFIDIGDAMMPGLTKLMGLAKKGVDAIAANPALAKAGDLLLNKFNAFATWVTLNWPIITTILSLGVEAMGASIKFAFDLIDTTTIPGKIFVTTMTAIAVVLGVAAIAAFTLMAPLYLLIAVLALLMYAVYKAVRWIVESIMAVASIVGGGSASPAATGTAITTAAETGIGARTAGFMVNMQAAPPTVAAVEQGPAGNSKTVNVNIDRVESGVDKDGLASTIRSQVKQQLEETS
jgi:tape measure domain-containing protein